MAFPTLTTIAPGVDTAFSTHLNNNFRAGLIFGDGSDGAFVSSGAMSLAAGVHRYSSFNLQAGHTLTTLGSGNTKPMIIMVTGDCTIAGNINLNGQGLAAATGLNMFGKLSTDSNQNYQGGYLIAQGGTSWTGGGGNGIGGTAGQSGVKDYWSNTLYNIMPLNFSLMTNGSGGGSGSAGYLNTTSAGGGGGASATTDGTVGQSGVSGTYSGAGGAGGCSLILIVNGNLTISGTINVSGANGAGTGGGGGGSGIIFIAYNGTFTDTGTYTANGGAGTTTGGAGAAGTTYKLPFSSLLTPYF